MNQKYGKGRQIMAAVFAVYLIFMAWVLFGRKHFDIGLPYWEEIKLNVNLTPFRTINGYLYILIHKTNPHLEPAAFLNLAGNVAAFIPLGFFVPYLIERERSFGRFLLHNILFIGAIELVQLFTLRGSCDIDDLILNVLGSAIGFCILRLAVTKRKAS